MKGVPIKFRGKSVIGEIYGYFVTREGKPYIANDAGTLVSVDEDTVSQLVGYDVDGKEIYEEDLLNDFAGDSYIVYCSTRVEDVLRDVDFEITPTEIRVYKLKLDKDVNISEEN